MIAGRSRIAIWTIAVFAATLVGLLAVSTEAEAHRLQQRTETSVYGNARGCVYSNVEHGGDAVVGGFVGANPFNAQCNSGVRANNVVDSRVTVRVQRNVGGVWQDCLTQSSGWRGFAPANASGRAYAWLTVRDLCNWRRDQVRARVSGSIQYNDGTIRSRDSLTSGHARLG